MLARYQNVVAAPVGGWPAEPAERRRRSGWSGMTAAERSQEMKRRQKLARDNKQQPTHPRQKGHPDHATFVRKISRAAKKRWQSMSPKARKDWQRKMQSGHQSKTRGTSRQAPSARAAINEIRQPAVA